ncbi:hypothetical protein ACIBKY_53700, partial [Nonomuraea sp. NPDC050394]
SMRHIRHSSPRQMLLASFTVAAFAITSCADTGVSPANPKAASDSAATPPSTSEVPENLKGRLAHQGQPVVGAKIRVEDANGKLIGEPKTNTQGTWTLQVPHPGTYKVTLDPTSLPNHITLLTPDRATRTVTAYEDHDMTVLFALTQKKTS